MPRRCKDAQPKPPLADHRLARRWSYEEPVIVTQARLTRQRPSAASARDVLSIDPVPSGADVGRGSRRHDLVEDQLKRAQVTRFEQMERERTTDKGFQPPSSRPYRG
jgi:hypothetical protein